MKTLQRRLSNVPEVTQVINGDNKVEILTIHLHNLDITKIKQ